MIKVMTTALATLCCLSLGAQSLPEPVIPHPQELHYRDTVRLVAIGDVMMHSRQLEYDCSEFLKGIEPLLRNADIAVANAEFTLGGKPYSGYPAFSAPDGYAAFLKDSCGIDVLLTANNHILDKGVGGLVRTLSVFDSLGIRHTGSAADSTEYRSSNPLMMFSRGMSIALVNFSYGTNAPAPAGPYPRVTLMNRDEVSRCIERAKDQGADFIIALPHWGQEYSLSHNAQQREWAEWLAGQGVDAIVGTHPHVVQDSCVIDGIPVAYSLGNAVSNMSATNTRLGLVAELVLVRDNAAGGKTCTMHLHFIWCTLPGTLTDNYRTIVTKEWANRRNDWLTPSDYDNMMKTLERVCASTGIPEP